MQNKNRTPLSRFAAVVGMLMLTVATLTACETPVRIPGLSFSFPETVPDFASAKQLSAAISVAPSTDRRPKYYGRDVASTGWTACKADTLETGTLPKLVDERITEALSKANTFSAIRPTSAQTEWTLIPEIQVFCSQTRGFVIRRVAGLVAIKFTLRKGDAVAWEQTIEHVVTDADPDYTGSSITTIEQAMRRTMADSLRLVLRDAMSQVDQEVRRS